MKARYTKRKFYGKWLYKATLSVPGISIFRLKNIDEVIEFCDSFYESQHSHGVRDKAYANKTKIKEIALMLSCWAKEDWAKRIEHNSIDLYTNDEEIYKEVSEKFEDIVSGLFEPNPTSLDSLDNPSHVLVTKYPHDRYRHKVYLLPHKITSDIDVRTSYVDWVEQQNPRILISHAVKQWFIKTIWNWDRRYVLVEDTQTLLMLKLRNPDVIGRVYDYVLTDK